MSRLDDAATSQFHDYVESVLQDPATALGDVFAGAYVDATNRQQVYVAFKGEAATEEARNDPRKAKLRTDPRIKFVSEGRSILELDGALSTIATKLDRLLDDASRLDGRFQASVNVRDNLVDVLIDSSVSNRKEEIDRELSAEVGSGIARLTYDAEVEETAAANECLPDTSLSTRENCQPIRGGLEILRPLGGGFAGRCTSGFVFRNSAGYRYMSTAGHCGNTLHRWYHGGLNASNDFIGDAVFVSNISGGTIDAALIDTENPKFALPNNSVFRYGNSNQLIGTKISAPGATLIGNYLCVEAAAGGRSCGELLSHNSTSEADGILLTNQGTMAATICEGDSGGPVLNNSTNRAYGLVRGFVNTTSPDCGSPSRFTWTAYVEDQSGFELLTKRATERMKRGQSLRGQYADQYLLSPNGSYKAVMQQDGNFVLYGPTGAIWSSGTSPSGDNFRIIMQTDGNLVIYTLGGTAVCAMGTGPSGSFLKMQDDGNLIVYTSGGTALWKRGPNSHPAGCSATGL